MVILTWEEFIVQKKRSHCASCQIVKVENWRAMPIPECINCYGGFCRWDTQHRDEMAMGNLNQEQEKIWEQFHKVWGHSKDQHYIKEEWMGLQLLIQKYFIAEMSREKLIPKRGEA